MAGRAWNGCGDISRHDADRSLGCRRAAWARTDGPSGKGRKWERAYLVGLTAGAAFGVGIVRSIKNSLSGFLLAAGAGFAIWAFGRRGAEGKRKASIRSKRETGKDGLGLRSTE